MHARDALNGKIIKYDGKNIKINFNQRGVVCRCVPSL
jgi:hypothetical protein